MSNGDDVILVVSVENDCDLLLLSVCDTAIDDENILLLYCRIVDVVGRLKEDENNRRLVAAMLCTTISKNTVMIAIDNLQIC